MAFRFLILCGMMLVALQLADTQFPKRQRLRPVTSDQLKRKNIQEFFLKDLKNNALMHNPGEYIAKTGFQQAKCSLERRTEMLNLTAESGIIYYPTCVIVSRCSGCCVGMRTCIPLTETIENIQVLKVKAKSHSSVTEKDVQRGTFITKKVRHEKDCSCECNIPQSACNPVTHTFNGMDCTCECKNIKERNNCKGNFVWDDNQCNCSCRHKKECSSGLEFDMKTCNCIIRNRDEEMKERIRNLFGLF